MSLFKAILAKQQPSAITVVDTEKWVNNAIMLLDDLAKHGGQPYHREVAQRLLIWASDLRLKVKT